MIRMGEASGIDQMPRPIKPHFDDRMKILKLKAKGVGRDKPRRDISSTHERGQQVRKVPAHTLTGDKRINRSGGCIA